MNKILPLVATLVLSISLPAFANHDGPDGHDGAACKRPDAAKHFKEADTDNDGTLDKAEFRAMHDKMFDKLDTDHDGTLTQDEMKAGRPHMKDKMKGH
jgi:Ca2+-binding EF-hand superfamily protein